MKALEEIQIKILKITVYNDHFVTCVIVYKLDTERIRRFDFPGFGVLASIGISML